MSQRSILAFAGCARAGSFNARLLAVAGARAAGATCTVLDLRDLEIPLYDGDLEAAHGLPPGVQKLRELLTTHAGFLIASPEYNGLPSPLLLNALDWATRGPGGVPDLAPFARKLAALVAASPGPWGGLRGLVHLRTWLTNVGVTVLAEQALVPAAMQAFGDDGRLRDEKQRARVERVGAALAQWLARA
jgi:NAD(P)H-dependent FMN reductase